jgi:Pyridoxamine 5'-phosphate oxidase
VPAEVPESHVDLLDRPMFAHLATVRPDGAPQTQVMWFGYQSLQQRHGRSYPIPDAAERVIVTIRPDTFIAHG